jgi:hypothetical protein
VAAANEDNANTDAELNEFNAVVIGANIDTEIDCTHFFFYFLSLTIQHICNIICKMAERGLTMLMHSVVIGVALYAVMVFLLKQSPAVAENRSVLIAAAVLMYMIVFGHGLPGRINAQL